MTWSSARESGGCGKFTRYEKCSADREELNNIISYAVSKDLDVKKKSKGKPKYD